MKRILLLCVFALPFLSASAQFKKGEKVLGGTVQWTHEKQDQAYDSKFNHFTFSPTLGVFLSPTLQHGVRLNTGYSKRTVPDFSAIGTTGSIGEMISKNYSLGGGYFMRKFKPLSNGFGLYGEAELNYTFFKTEIDYKNVPTASSSDSKYWRAGAAVNGGFYYRPSAKWMFSAGTSFLSLDYTRWASYNKQWNSKFGISNGLSLSAFFILP
ncbi:MAG: hypothetical protein ACO1NW_13800 [Chitinophagaceae bacterium]